MSETSSTYKIATMFSTLMSLLIQLAIIRDTALIAGIVGATCFLAIGLACLLWPEKVQRYYLGFYERTPKAAKHNPFLSWMYSPGYVLALRAIGVVGIGAFILISFTLIMEVFTH